MLFTGCESSGGEADDGGVVDPVKYTITFDSTGGSSVDPAIVNEGSKVSEPASPQRHGHIFGGWYSDESCADSYRWYFSTNTVNADITLFAKWTERTKYKVIYDGNGSTAGDVPVDDLEYYTGDEFTVLDKGSLVKIVNGVEFIFRGWHYTENYDEYLTPYQAGRVLTMGSYQFPSNQDLVLYAQWTAIKQAGPAGGIIFYDKGEYTDGWRFMEVAPASTEWSDIEWGYCDFDDPGPSMTSDGIGTGLANTESIVAFHESIDYEHTYNSGYPHYANGTVAAKLCYDLEVTNNGTTYDDWFLPSYQEIRLINKVKTEAAIGVTPFVDFYWSSTEWIDDPESCYTAWGFYFPNGNGSGGNKKEERRVRAVRRF